MVSLFTLIECMIKSADHGQRRRRGTRASAEKFPGGGQRKKMTKNSKK